MRLSPAESLTEYQAAERLGETVATLALWRTIQDQARDRNEPLEALIPTYHRVGRGIRYERAEVERIRERRAALKAALGPVARDRYVDTMAAARYLGVSDGTMRFWRLSDLAGPRYTTLGHRTVRYRWSDLVRFAAMRRRNRVFSLAKIANLVFQAGRLVLSGQDPSSWLPSLEQKLDDQIHRSDRVDDREQALAAVADDLRLLI